MTLCMEVLRYMVGRERVLVSEIALAVKCSDLEARGAVQALKKKKHVELQPEVKKGRVAIYRVTDAGLQRSLFRPKNPSARATAKRQQRQAVDEQRRRAVLAAIARQEERRTLAERAQIVVGMAKAARHPLDMAWSTAHA